MVGLELVHPLHFKMVEAAVRGVAHPHRVLLALELLTKVLLVEMMLVAQAVQVVVVAQER